jgi:DNA polymerase III delta prime subunit
MKAVQLFSFIREFAGLTQKPVESLDSYIKTFWLDQIPHEPECSFVAWTDSEADEDTHIENWLAVERPERPDPPAVDEELKPWLNAPQWQNSALDAPVLLTRILNPSWNEDGPITELKFLELEEHLQLWHTWDEYIHAEWRPWAEEDRRKAKVQECYDELFAMHRTQMAMGEQYEFLLAVGCLHWATPSGGNVKRHLLVLPVTVDFDSVNAVAAVRSSGSAPEAQFEADMLVIQERPPTDIEGDTETRRSLLGGNLFHHDAKTLLRAYVQGLDSQGVFADTLVHVKGTPPQKPVVTFAPALIVRRRTSKSLIAVCDSIIKQLQAVGEDGVPACIRKFVGELGVDEAIYGNVQVKQNGEDGADHEIYFPLPYNYDQKRILETLDRQVGVLVQGPPGTGKSQTIANLICHLLATGKRILVTSQKAPALRVLKEKLPSEVADLCVMILGEGVDEQQELQRSVGQVASRRTNWLAWRSQALIEDLHAELASARREEAKAFEALCAVREKETFIHPSLFSIYEGTISEIAGQVRHDAGSFAWFRDRLPDSITLINHPPPPLPVERTGVERLLYLLCQITPDDEVNARKILLLLDDIPSVNQFSAMVLAEEKAEMAFINQKQCLVHPSCDAISTLNTIKLSQLLDEFDDFHGRLLVAKNADSDWEWRIAEEVMRGNSVSFEALKIASCELLDHIIKEAQEVSDIEVAGLGDRTPRAIMQDARDLKVHLEQGGRKGILVFRPAVVKQGLYLMREVTIDGRVCDTPDSLGRLARWLQLHESIKKLGEQWAALTVVDTDHLPLNQVIGQYKQLQSRLDATLALRGKIEELNRRLDACDKGALRLWHDLEAVERLRNLVAVLVAQRELQEARHTIAEAEAVVHGVCLQPESAKENHRLKNAIHTRSMDEFAGSHEELARLWKCRLAYEERDQLRSVLSKELPELVQALTTSFRDGEWGGRIRKLEEAWNWLCADQWLSQMADHSLEESLQQQIRQIRNRASLTLSKLAAEKAWQHCMVSLDKNPQAYQNLMAWSTAIANVGGGTGRHAEHHRQIARDCLEGCRDAVPAWVMPLYKVLETVPVRRELFDVVIIDEASQSGVEALFLSFLTKQIVVVGDDQQIRPDYVGIDQSPVHQLQARHLSDIPNAFLFGPPQSLFSAAAVFFGTPIRLREHFRCMPEIISFSNRLCYVNQPLIPLRQFGNKRLTPVLNAYYISGGYQEARTKINPVEAEEVVSAIERCCEDPSYAGKTFGVISLLHSSDQARAIESLLIKRLDAEEIEQRNIVCGDAYDFQGDERDVIFLSMVSARSDQGRIGTMSDEKAKRRFNVAVSRARDQVQLFHSVQEGELGQSCLRRRLLAHMKQPPVDPTAQLPWTVEELRQFARNNPRNKGNQPSPFDSWFEVDVFLSIAGQGHLAIIPQYEVHGYRIDIVIVGGSRKVAVECDGDWWHGPQQYADDLHRQSQLERCGWEFFRVRGSHFYRDPDGSLLPLWKMLEPHDIADEDCILSVVIEDQPEEEGRAELKVNAVQQWPEQSEDESEATRGFENDARTVDALTVESGKEVQSLQGTKIQSETSKKPTSTKSTLEQVLLMTPREVGKSICNILEECPNYSSKKDDLTKRVCKHFGIKTSGTPRNHLTKKIGWALTYLKKAGKVEEYKATNIRIRLLHSNKQGRLF